MVRDSETRYHEDLLALTYRLEDSLGSSYTHIRTYAHTHIKDKFFRIFYPEFFLLFEKKFKLTTTSRRIERQYRVEVDVLNSNVE